MSEYAIRKPAESCATCGGPFEKGQEHFSAILLEEQEPARRDFCVACFQGRERDPAREFAFWKTKRTVEGPERRPVDFNTLRELFFRMAESHAAEYRKLCYLLGLVLLRKRVVKLEEFATENGQDFLVVSTKGREEPLRLEAPELVPAEFEELREKLKALLDVDLEDDAVALTGRSSAAPGEGAVEPDPPAPGDPPASGVPDVPGDSGSASAAD